MEFEKNYLIILNLYKKQKESFYIGNAVIGQEVLIEWQRFDINVEVNEKQE